MLIYTLRPNGDSLWIPHELAKRIGIKRRGDQLTEEQMSHPDVKSWIEENSRIRK